MISRFWQGVTASDHLIVEAIAPGLGIAREDILYQWDYVLECWVASHLVLATGVVVFATSFGSVGWVEA